MKPSPRIWNRHRWWMLTKIRSRRPSLSRKSPMRCFGTLATLRKLRSWLKTSARSCSSARPAPARPTWPKSSRTTSPAEHGSTRLVQFHPSYAYEDFVEGYRPTEAGGFSLSKGPLKRIAQQAAKTPDARHVLVIDEINRGNLAKVFGELYFLLEYRNRQISLQYSDDQFKLPENLWVIATMNTADRSIALVDAALRRRFYFVPFFPDEPPIKGLLDRWLRDKEKPEMLWVAEVVDAANRILDELDKRDMAIGPSHFMRDDLDDEWVKRIWKHSIVPYVEEQLFGEHERVKDFELDKLRGKVEPGPAGGEAAGASEPQGD